MKRIVLANLAGPYNPGDQAILQGSLKLIRKTYPESKITLITRNIAQQETYRHLGCDAVPSYPNVERMATDSLLKKSWGGLQALLTRPLAKEVIRSSDAVFLIGGGYFYSYRKWLPGLTYLSHLTSVRWGQKFQKPVIFLPQSYGPFCSGIAMSLFRKALEGANCIFYREQISGDWLNREFPEKSDRFVSMPDCALYLNEQDLLGRENPSGSQGPGRRIGVTLRSWNIQGKDEGIYLGRLARVLNRYVCEKDYTVRIIVHVHYPTKGEGDWDVSKRFKDRFLTDLPSEKIEWCNAEPYFTLPQISSLYRECDLVVGMRLHSCLMSMILGRPALAVGYQPKSEGILKSLGLHELYLGSWAEVEENILGEKINQVLGSTPEWTKKIQEVLSQGRQQIDDAFQANRSYWEK